MGLGYIFTGQTQKPRELITELEVNITQHPVSNYDLGQLHIAFGDFDMGYFYCEKALEMHEGRVLYMNLALPKC